MTIPRIRSESPAFDLHHPEVAALEMEQNDALGESELVDAPSVDGRAELLKDNLGKRARTSADEGTTDEG